MRQYVLEKRWIPWHILCLVLFGLFVRLAFWQWQAASAPHPTGYPVQVWRNYAYAINWLVFAGVTAWFWWRFMRDQRQVELTRDQQAAAEAAEPDDADADGAR